MYTFTDTELFIPITQSIRSSRIVLNILNISLLLDSPWLHRTPFRQRGPFTNVKLVQRESISHGNLQPKPCTRATVQRSNPSQSPVAVTARTSCVTDTPDAWDCRLSIRQRPTNTFCAAAMTKFAPMARNTRTGVDCS